MFKSHLHHPSNMTASWARYGEHHFLPELWRHCYFLCQCCSEPVQCLSVWYLLRNLSLLYGSFTWFWSAKLYPGVSFFLIMNVGHSVSVLSIWRCVSLGHRNFACKISWVISSSLLEYLLGIIFLVRSNFILCHLFSFSLFFLFSGDCFNLIF